MAVSLANDESYVMVGKSAGESGDPASSWNTVRFVVNKGKDDTIVVDDTYYDGAKDVLFRGVQKAPKDLIAKIYRPVFKGKAEIRGGAGGGGPSSYEWKVYANEPITRGTVTVKSWFVYADTFVVVSGDSYSLGPVVAPPDFITQVWAEDLFTWWLQDTGQQLWDAFCDQLSERVLEWLGDFGALISDLRSFTNAINSRMNMIHSALEASGAAGSNLDFFQISATANGALRAVYTENGSEKMLNLTFSVEGVGQFHNFEIEGALEALKDDRVINIIYNKVQDWRKAIDKKYEAAIRTAIRSAMGNDIDIEFE